MTTKTDITLPLLPEAAFPGLAVGGYGGIPRYLFAGDQMQAYARAAVEADRADHFRDATKMVPSDEELLGLLQTCGALTTAAGIRAIRVALSRYSSGQPAASAEPIEMRGVAETVKAGDGFWRSCSGCHELNEGVPTGPYSSTLKCHLGNGCSECGGIGAIWDMTDYGAMGDEMARKMVTPVAQEPVGEVRIESDYWSGGHFYHGHRKEAALFKSFYDLPVGAKLYAAPVAAQAQHQDDAAVEAFAAAMKAKLAQKRAEGRGGWKDKTQCSQDRLSLMLRGHVAKGDPVDVANFAMMLHQRGERISGRDAASPSAQDFDDCTASPTGKHSESWFANGDCEYCKAGAQPNAPLFYAQAQPDASLTPDMQRDEKRGAESGRDREDTR